MQVWPRKRSKRKYVRVQGPARIKEAKLQGFAGYKAGMSHIIITDARKTSPTKGEDISFPVTIVECPPIKIIGARFYKQGYNALQPSTDIIAKADKDLAKKIDPAKKQTKKIEDVKPEDFDELRAVVQTQPRMTTIGQKIPEVFEVAVGGSKEDKLKFIKENFGKELSIKDVFKEGQLIDVRAVTKGKGYQGPVKRFGIKVRHHKSEKTKRGPGSLGGWSKQGHVMYRVAFAGQMGYHTRIEYNKQILMISDDPKKINVSGGFKHYGDVKSTYILLKGSIQGPAKRIVRLESAIRPTHGIEQVAPTIQYISQASKQGN
jgi:large subunit ribosomal protein L3